MSIKRFHMDKDSVPKLIDEVRKRECIWNYENETYNDRYFTTKAWKELSEIMEQPEEILKVKWKNLRDMFKKEMKQHIKRNRPNHPIAPMIESIEDYRGKWKHFAQMFFIHKPGEYVSCNNEVEDDTMEVTYLEDEENPLENFVKCEPSDKLANDHFFVVEQPQPVPAKRKREQEDDYDMMFLKSLTPYFKQLDPLRKLIARNKIQDVLINEIAVQQGQSNKNKSSS